GFILPVIDSFLCEVAKSKRPRPTNRRWLELCVDPNIRRSGDGQQVFHGDSAGCSLPVRVVDGGPLALVQRSESAPHLSDVHRCQCLIDMDARLGTGGSSYRSTVGADLAGAPG